MNRYERHIELKEAEEKGYKRGRAEGERPSFSYAMGHPMPRNVSYAPVAPGGKYKCKVEISPNPNSAAYTITATLFVGNKYYNAIQHVSLHTIAELQGSGNMPQYIERWLEGAYLAMWKEFKKDVVFDMPTAWRLDQFSSF